MLTLNVNSSRRLAFSQGMNSMNKFFATGIAALFAMNLAFAQAPAAPATPAATPATPAAMPAAMPAAPAAKVATPAPAPVATSNCEAKAVDKNGKPLSGAAKTSSIKKCEGGAKAAPSDCEAKAVGKNGKPLAGAAKTSFIKKCEADAAK